MNIAIFMHGQLLVIGSIKNGLSQMLHMYRCLLRLLIIISTSKDSCYDVTVANEIVTDSVEIATL